MGLSISQIPMYLFNVFLIIFSLFHSTNGSSFKIEKEDGRHFLKTLHFSLEWQECAKKFWSLEFRLCTVFVNSTEAYFQSALWIWKDE